MTKKQESNIRINTMQRKILEIMIEESETTQAEFMAAVHAILLDISRKSVLAENKDAS